VGSVSQEYTRQRTLAIKEELELHYFPQTQQLDGVDVEKEPGAEEKTTLQGYQALCHEVGIDPSDSVAEDKRQLKTTLANIVDLIDARQTGERVKIWGNLENSAPTSFRETQDRRPGGEEASSVPCFVIAASTGGPVTQNKQSSEA